MSVVIDEPNVTAFLEDPAGGVATYMRNTIVPPILDLAKLTISRPWPGAGTGRGSRFPPPGPPYARTRDLLNSLTVVVSPGPSGTEFYIVPTSLHRGANYGVILKSRGYQFMPPDYYI